MATLTIPDPVPSPAEDAEQLMKAFKGWGTDEMAVIDLLAHRDANQRTQIRIAYEELYNENLIKRLESEIHGQFERAVYRWLFPPVDREAMLAKFAMQKKFDITVIIEIACVSSPSELLAIKNAYQSLYKHSLEEDVATHLVGDIRQLLVGLVGTYRYGGDEVNVALASAEAEILHKAFEEKAFNNEEVVRIITTRSKAQLNATFNKYRDQYGTPLSEVLGNETESDLALALAVAVQCIVSPLEYYEKVLRVATDKSSFDDNSLTRVIVTRAEKDLKIIMDLYYKKNSIKLQEAVAHVTHGDYKRFLLALLDN